MLVNERHDRIFNILKQRKSATVDYLSSNLYVSKSTIRRDLTVLQSKGYIKHSYGGAVLIDEALYTLPIDFRELKEKPQKRIIGHKAAQLIENGDIIFIDSSSTVLYMIDYMRERKSLSVVTNNFRAIELLQQFENIKLYSTGGIFTQNSKSLTGRFALNTIENMSYDKVFFSPTGVGQNGILTECGEQENIIRCAALKNASIKVCLCDHSKLNKSFMFHICNISQVDYIVCDTDIYGSINTSHTQKPKQIIAK